MRYGLDAPTRLAQQTNCHWCSNPLGNLRNLYKGINSERWYCSSEHLQRGETAHIQRAVKAAGFQSPWYIGLAAVLAVFMLTFATVPKARAQGHEGHAQHHDIYKDWTQSNGWSSCCNGDDPKTGKKGDCRPARAYPDEHGQWHVLINGKYRPVPLGAIRDYPTPDGNSHVCEDENNGIMCFVRGLPKS